MLRAGIGASDDDFVVLFAGKFQDRKRPLDAVRSVARLGHGAMLMTAGDGPLATDVREAAARLAVRLAWRGFMNQSAMPEAFVAADCLIVPSEWETWGLIVNEALASGLPCVVTINGFPTDSPKEIALVKELALNAGAETVVVHEGFGKGGDGAVDLANAVVTACEKPNTFNYLTPDGTPVVDQIRAIAQRIYGATDIDLQMQAQKDLERVNKLGLGTAPVCMAKTQMSLSHDPALRNRPTGFVLPVRSLVPSAGAGFVIALCGDMQRMPGLGKTPAFQKMDIDENGVTYGLT